ncbi:MAG TPA: amino acid adenylation domain-containing protein, partial [Streptosporangiaceae bacterium]
MLSDSQRAMLAARLRRGRTESAGKIPRRPGDLADLPLSYGQEQLWFLDRFAPGLPTYNIPQALGLSGPLDGAALGRALDALVARHEALRTRLVTTPDHGPVQVIDPPGQVPLELVDLSGHEAQARAAALREFIDAEAVRPFSLALGPLLRAHLVRLAADDHVLMIVVHHAVFDGWSAGVLRRELAALYGQEAAGEPSGLPELPVQFADFAVWERQRLGGQALAELEAYWRGALAGLPAVQFPTDRPRPVVDSFDGGLAGRTASRELLDGLRELARSEGTTLFVVLMTALHALICRYTGQTDLVVGTVSANRGRSELTPLIGFLVNTLPIRADLSGDPSFTELLARVRDATVGAYGHQDLPFGKLVEVLGVERDASRAPVFQIALTYAERDTSAATAAGVDFTLTDLIVGIDAAKFDLTLAAEARTEGLWLECSYKTALFDRPTIDRLLEHFQTLLSGAVADPSTRLSRLPVLTPDELHRELVEWNDTAGEVPATCAHEAFGAQVARTPDAVAAEFESEQVTYADLNRQASQIARTLRGLGVGPEVLVGVCMRTGLRRLAALLGIWKAGGGYVPLDPELPAERMSFMMADAQMAVVLADDSTVASLPGTTATVLSLDAAWEEVTSQDDSDVTGTGVTHSNVAYVIYTSGSTGRPKGVMVEHRQVVNFVQGIRERWQIGAGDAVLGFASLSFDVSVMDMYVPLLSGARLVLGSPETLHSPPRLAALIRDAGVTFACLSPAVLGVLRDEQFADLRVLMTAGEELPAELARRWIGRGPRLVNGYGPTETTVLATYADIDASVPLPPPIGLPCRPNYQAYVLDEHLNPVPAGAAGELHIGGAGVARGYLNRPDLTAQRFIDDPFRPGGRLYKTGDLVKRRTDGSIVYLGRIDTQVKIRGLRVELGEIETALTT